MAPSLKIETSALSEAALRQQLAALGLGGMAVLQPLAQGWLVVLPAPPADTQSYAALLASRWVRRLAFAS